MDHNNHPISDAKIMWSKNCPSISEIVPVNFVAQKIIHVHYTQSESSRLCV